MVRIDHLHPNYPICYDTVARNQGIRELAHSFPLLIKPRVTLIQMQSSNKSQLLGLSTLFYTLWCL